MTTVSHEIEKQ